MKKKTKVTNTLKGVSLALLISDDNTRIELETSLRKTGCNIVASSSIDSLMEETTKTPTKALLLDVESADNVQKQYREDPELLSGLGSEIVILAEEGETGKAYKFAHQLQGYFLTLPVEVEELALVLERALDTGLLKNRLARYETPEISLERFGEMVVKSPEMKDVVRLARILSSRDDSLLIVGGVGTGKEILAKTIHENSNRRHGPFYSINCKSFTSEDLAVELFGRGEPDSNDASEEKNFLEMAEGGTLLLDEIGSVSPNVQAKLQRFLEDGTYTRVNTRTVCKADVRIFAATSQPLDERVAKGEFSEDLYFRLNRFTLHLPALRRRVEDIPVLVKTILNRMATEKEGEPLQFTEESLKLLMEYTWPGNVRELENVLDFAALVAGEGPIEPKHLPKQFHDEVGSIFVGSSEEDLPPMSEIERRYILRVMEATRGNKVKAAAILDINRATLHRKLQQYEKQKIAELA